MSDIEIPPSLQWVSYLAGGQWPQGSETGMFRIDDYFAATAWELESLIPDLNRVREETLSVLFGDTANAAEEQFAMLFDGDHAVKKLSEAVSALGDAAGDLGTEIEYSKAEIILCLAFAAYYIRYLWAYAASTGGKSLAVIPVVEQATVSAIRRVVGAALTRIAGAVRAMLTKTGVKRLLKEGAEEGAQEVAMAGGIMGYQVGKGTRAKIDYDMVRLVALAGFLGGTAGMGTAYPVYGALGPGGNAAIRALKGAITDVSANVAGNVAANKAVGGETDGVSLLFDSIGSAASGGITGIGSPSTNGANVPRPPPAGSLPPEGALDIGQQDGDAALGEHDSDSPSVNGDTHSSGTPENVAAAPVSAPSTNESPPGAVAGAANDVAAPSDSAAPAATPTTDVASEDEGAAPDRSSSMHDAGVSAPPVDSSESSVPVGVPGHPTTDVPVTETPTRNGPFAHEVPADATPPLAAHTDPIVAAPTADQWATVPTAADSAPVADAAGPAQAITPAPVSGAGTSPVAAQAAMAQPLPNTAQALPFGRTPAPKHDAPHRIWASSNAAVSSSAAAPTAAARISDSTATPAHPGTQRVGAAQVAAKPAADHRPGARAGDPTGPAVRPPMYPANDDEACRWWVLKNLSVRYKRDYPHNIPRASGQCEEVYEAVDVDTERATSYAEIEEKLMALPKGRPGIDPGPAAIVAVPWSHGPQAGDTYLAVRDGDQIYLEDPRSGRRLRWVPSGTSGPRVGQAYRAVVDGAEIYLEDRTSGERLRWSGTRGPRGRGHIFLAVYDEKRDGIFLEDDAGERLPWPSGQEDKLARDADGPIIAIAIVDFEGNPLKTRHGTPSTDDVYNHRGATPRSADAIPTPRWRGMATPNERRYATSARSLPAAATGFGHHLPHTNPATLTPREDQVMALIANGLTTAEISAQLFMDLTTVQTHIARITAKLGARNHTHLVAIANTQDHRTQDQTAHPDTAYAHAIGPVQGHPQRRLAALSPRDYEATVLLAAGLTAAQIADEMGVKTGTVSASINRALSVLDLDSREELVMMAYELGAVAAWSRDKAIGVSRATQDKLNDPDRELWKLVAKGLTDAEIASKLRITRKAAENRLARLKGKLGAEARTQMVAMAYQSGVAIPRWAQERLRPLTDQQRAVLALLARGLITAQIDTNLGLDRGTALSDVESMVDMLGAEEHTLVVLAYRGGLVRPGSAEVPVPVRRKLAQLSPVEAEVLALLGEGFSTAQIDSELGLQPGLAARNHVPAIMRKLDARASTQLVVLGHRIGLQHIGRQSAAGRVGEVQGLPAQGLAERLNGRELDVLKLMAKGHSDTEIADEVHITSDRVGEHVSRIMSELGARVRTQVVWMAYESGLVRPGSPTEAPVALEQIRAKLNPRERRMMVLLAKGRTNAEIAAAMSIKDSDRVKTDLRRIEEKLEARDRTQLVWMAYESGLVRPELQYRAQNPPLGQANESAAPVELPTTTQKRLPGLTDDEHDVLVLVAGALTDDDIAARLTIRPEDVRTHVRHIMTKLRARDRAELVMWAYKHHLVRPGSRPAARVTLEEITRLLSPRLCEVMTLVARGLSDAEIADALSIRETTVKKHVRSILETLGARDRTELAWMAYESYLERPGPRAEAPKVPTNLPELTDREREVMALVGEGLSNTEIAARLSGDVHPRTLKFTVSEIMTKLGARGRTHLVSIAHDSGLVSPGSTAPDVSDQDLAELTSDDRRVLRLVAEGLTIDEISARLSFSQETVKVIRRHLMTVLDARDPERLVAKARGLMGREGQRYDAKDSGGDSGVEPTGDVVAEPARLAQPPPPPSTNPPELTDGEQAVLKLLAEEGLSNIEIAARLPGDIAPTTVNSTVRVLMRTLGARTRTQLVSIAHDSGLVRPGATAPDISADRLAELTPDHYRVLALTAKGFTNWGAIAAGLSLEKSTVDTIVGDLMMTLDTSVPTKLVARAYQCGLLGPGGRQYAANAPGGHSEVEPAGDVVVESAGPAQPLTAPATSLAELADRRREVMRLVVEGRSDAEIAGRLSLDVRNVQSDVNRILSKLDDESGVTRPRSRLAELTSPERQVMVQMAMWRSTDAIAAHLSISWETAQQHVNRLITKLGVEDRGQAAVMSAYTLMKLGARPPHLRRGLVDMAHESGLVRPGPQEDRAQEPTTGRRDAAKDVGEVQGYPNDPEPDTSPVVDEADVRAERQDEVGVVEGEGPPVAAAVDSDSMVANALQARGVESADELMHPVSQKKVRTANARKNRRWWKRLTAEQRQELIESDPYFVGGLVGIPWVDLAVARARANAAWWMRLSPEQRQELIKAYPRQIGNSKGIYPIHCDAANQLVRESDRVRANQIQATIDKGAPPSAPLSPDDLDFLMRWNRIEEGLRDAREAAALAGVGGPLLTAYDPDAFGGDGRAEAVFVSKRDDFSKRDDPNPPRFDSVLWTVPGVNTTIDDLGHFHDPRYPYLPGALNVLQSTLREATADDADGPTPSVASKLWIGYHTPNGKREWRAIGKKLAREGGDILNVDICASNAAQDVWTGDGSHFSNNKVFAHSYGSTVAAFAGRDQRLDGKSADTREVESVVLEGSGGAGPQKHARDFGSGVRVYAAASSFDATAAMGGRTPRSNGRILGILGIGLGTDPAMESFGAVRITSEFPSTMNTAATTATHRSYHAHVDTTAYPPIRGECLANCGKIGADLHGQVDREANRTAKGRRTFEPAAGRQLRLDGDTGAAHSANRHLRIRLNPRWGSVDAVEAWRVFRGMIAARREEDAEAATNTAPPPVSPGQIQAMIDRGRRPSNDDLNFLLWVNRTYPGPHGTGEAQRVSPAVDPDGAEPAATPTDVLTPDPLDGDLLDPASTLGPHYREEGRRWARAFLSDGPAADPPATDDGLPADDDLVAQRVARDSFDDLSDAELPDPVGILGLPHYWAGTLSVAEAAGVYADGKNQIRRLNEELVRYGASAEDRAWILFDLEGSLRSWTRGLISDGAVADSLFADGGVPTFEDLYGSSDPALFDPRDRGEDYREGRRWARAFLSDGRADSVGDPASGAGTFQGTSPAEASLPADSVGESASGAGLFKGTLPVEETLPAGDRWQAVPSGVDPDGVIARQALLERVPFPFAVLRDGELVVDWLRHCWDDPSVARARARANAAWWHGLTGVQQRAVMDAIPREIGIAEGISVTACHMVNSEWLDELRAELQSRKDSGERLSRADRKLGKRLDRIHKALHDETEKAKKDKAGGPVGGPYLKAFDPFAFDGQGLAVAAFASDPDDTNLFGTHSASLDVPGVGMTIDQLGFNMRVSHRGLLAIKRRRSKLSAWSLTWLGYKMPRGFVRAISPALARAGGDVLYSAVTAYNAARAALGYGWENIPGYGVDPAIGLHIFPHSYGSTVFGYAARKGRMGPEIRSVNPHGSPGMGPIQYADEIGPGVDVNVGASSRDPFTMLGGRLPGAMGRIFGIRLGRDPAMKSFGAKRRAAAEFPARMDRMDKRSLGTHNLYHSYVDDEAEPPVESEWLAARGCIGAGLADKIVLDPFRTVHGHHTVEPAAARTPDPAETRQHGHRRIRKWWNPRGWSRPPKGHWEDWWVEPGKHSGQRNAAKDVGAVQGPPPDDPDFEQEDYRKWDLSNHWVFERLGDMIDNPYLYEGYIRLLADDLSLEHGPYGVELEVVEPVDGVSLRGFVLSEKQEGDKQEVVGRVTGRFYRDSEGALVAHHSLYVDGDARKSWTFCNAMAADLDPIFRHYGISRVESTLYGRSLYAAARRPGETWDPHRLQESLDEIDESAKRLSSTLSPEGQRELDVWRKRLNPKKAELPEPIELADLDSPVQPGLGRGLLEGTAVWVDGFGFLPAKTGVHLVRYLQSRPDWLPPIADPIESARPRISGAFLLAYKLRKMYKRPFHIDAEPAETVPARALFEAAESGAHPTTFTDVREVLEGLGPDSSAIVATRTPDGARIYLGRNIDNVIYLDNPHVKGLSPWPTHWDEDDHRFTVAGYICEGEPLDNLNVGGSNGLGAADAVGHVQGPPPRDLEQLTPRERDVLLLVSEGLTEDEIAGRLFVAVATVKEHVGRIMAKFGARSRTKLITIAYESGLVEAGSRPKLQIPPPTSLEKLSPRQREVLTLLAEGFTNAEIGRRMIVGELTVKSYIKDMLTKLDLQSRYQLVVFAHESGRVGPGARDEAPVASESESAELSRRETEVLVLLAEGLTVGEIAARLRIDRGSVNTCLTRAQSKLGAGARTQLVVFAYESGLVEARPGAEPPASATSLDMLSRRERQVMVLLAKGLTEAEISRQLFINEDTVRWHIGEILEKLGLSTPTQIVVMAYQCGLEAEPLNKPGQPDAADDVGHVQGPGDEDAEQPTPPDLALLSTRELDVVTLLAEGRTEAEIDARPVHGTRATARNDIDHALAKLEARDPEQLVMWAYQSGLVDAGAVRPVAPATKLDDLTSRERDVMVLRAKDFSIVEIAAQLSIDQTTVRSDIRTSLKKLELDAPTQLVAMAYQCGLADSPPVPAAHGLSALTLSEREVMTLVAAALTNDEIAATMSLSRESVVKYVKRVTTKLGVVARTQIVMMAYATGLARPRRDDDDVPVGAVMAESATPVRPSGLPVERLSTLTSREREVVVLVAAGLTNDEIAAPLSTTESDVKAQVERIRVKLGVHDRAQIVVMAYESGLARPGRQEDHAQDVPTRLSDSPDVEPVREVVSEFAARAKPPAVTEAKLEELSRREHDVTVLVAEGLTNDEIAARLFVDPKSVESSVTRALARLGARDRGQLVVLAYESGVVRPGIRSKPVGPAASLLEFTPRQREVMALLAERLNDHEIAARLFISPGTVRGHVTRIMTKLGARNRAEFVAMYERGLPETVRDVVAERAARAKPPRVAEERLEELSQRERQVTVLLAEGLTDAQIAKRLFVGPKTVKSYVARAVARLDARDREQLVVMAYENGLVHPDRQADTTDAAVQRDAARDVGKVQGPCDEDDRADPSDAPTPDFVGDVAELSPDEQMMLVLLAGDLTDDEIALRLWVSKSTVSAMINDLSEKLWASDRASLVVRAYHGGLVRAGWRADAPTIPQTLLAALSKQERKAIALLAAGHDERAIATTLKVPPGDLSSTLDEIQAKLGARDRTQLVIMAYERGLVRPEGGGDVAAHPAQVSEVGEPTPREQVLMVLLARGLTDTEIAARLGVGEDAVVGAVADLLVRLEAQDRAQLVAMAHYSGLVPARSQSDAPDIRLPELTEREHDVMVLRAQGRSEADIALELMISLGDVSVTLAGIQAKLAELGAHGSTDVVKIAYDSGLVRAEPAAVQRYLRTRPAARQADTVQTHLIAVANKHDHHTRNPVPRHPDTTSAHALGPVQGHPKRRLAELTPRQYEATVLLAAGLTSAQIADRMTVGEDTAFSFIRRAVSSLGLNNREELVAMAYEQGVVVAWLGDQAMAVPKANLDRLTKRDREVWKLVAKGLTNADIAAELVLRPLAAESRVVQLKRKLGAEVRTQMVAMAYHSGVVIPRWAAERLAALTDRQRQVLALLASGLITADIDTRLSLDPGTADSEVRKMLNKLGAEEPTQLAVLAYRGGLVRLPTADVPADLKRKLARLSARERQVMALLGKGFSTAQIDSELGLPPGSARNHVRAIMNTLGGVRGSNQLVVVSHRSGLVHTGHAGLLSRTGVDYRDSVDPRGEVTDKASEPDSLGADDSSTGPPRDDAEPQRQAEAGAESGRSASEPPEEASVPAIGADEYGPDQHEARGPDPENPPVDRPDADTSRRQSAAKNVGEVQGRPHDGPPHRDTADNEDAGAFTPGEREVLAQLADGRDFVDASLNSVKAKFGSENQSELVIRAYERGVLVPPAEVPELLSAGLASLSLPERAVLVLLAGRLDYAEIAACLSISDDAARVHANRAAKKLGIKIPAGRVAVAYQGGLLRPRAEAPGPSAMTLADLSRDEREVLALLDAGVDDAEIAKLLSIGDDTVAEHVGTLMTKLRAGERSQLVPMAYECGLLLPGAEALAAASAKLAALPVSERAVVMMLAGAPSTAEIAARLSLDQRPGNVEVDSVRRKLGARDLDELAEMAYKHGLIGPRADALRALSTRLAGLPDRQRMMLVLLAEGHSTEVVAERSISKYSPRAGFAMVESKLGAKNMCELVTMAYQGGLVRPAAEVLKSLSMRLAALTQPEKALLALLSDELTDIEIAHRLRLGQKALSAQISSLMRKVGVPDRNQLEKLARESRRMASQPDTRRDLSEKLAALSLRDREIVELLGFGLGDDEIAAQLNISPRAVASHVDTMLDMLDVAERHQLVAMAGKSGLISFRPAGGMAARLAKLTDWHRALLALVAGGLTGAEISARLSVRQATLPVHVGSVMTTLGVRDRAELAMVAHETGLVRPGGEVSAAVSMRLAALSTPERLMLNLLVEGLDDAELAAQLTLDEETVTRHVNNVMKKLGANERSQFVAMGYEVRLKHLGDEVPEALLTRLATLSDRERDVLALLAAGFSTTEIAGRTAIDERAVNEHVANAMMKLAARDRCQLVARAYEGRFVELNAETLGLGGLDAADDRGDVQGSPDDDPDPSDAADAGASGVERAGAAVAESVGAAEPPGEMSVSARGGVDLHEAHGSDPGNRPMDRPDADNSGRQSAAKQVGEVQGHPTNPEPDASPVVVGPGVLAHSLAEASRLTEHVAQLSLPFHMNTACGPRAEAMLSELRRLSVPAHSLGIARSFIPDLSATGLERAYATGAVMKKDLHPTLSFSARMQSGIGRADTAAGTVEFEGARFTETGNQIRVSPLQGDERWILPAPGEAEDFCNHTAPTIRMRTADGQDTWGVIDPMYDPTKPMSLREWHRRQNYSEAVVLTGSLADDPGTPFNVHTELMTDVQRARYDAISSRTPSHSYDEVMSRFFNLQREAPSQASPSENSHSYYSYSRVLASTILNGNLLPATIDASGHTAAEVLTRLAPVTAYQKWLDLTAWGENLGSADEAGQVHGPDDDADPSDDADAVASDVESASVAVLESVGPAAAPDVGEVQGHADPDLRRRQDAYRRRDRKTRSVETCYAEPVGDVLRNVADSARVRRFAADLSGVYLSGVDTSGEDVEFRADLHGLAIIDGKLDRHGLAELMRAGVELHGLHGVFELPRDLDPDKVADGRTNLNVEGVEGDGILIFGPILNGDDVIGEQCRTFYRDKRNRLVVREDLLKLEEKFRRKGFSKALRAELLPRYRAWGVVYVEMYAGLENGGLVWALKGLTWHPDARKRRESLMFFRLEIKKLISRFPAAEKPLKELLRKVHPDHPELPEPIDLATMTVAGIHLDRELMEGMAWWGALWL